MGENGTETIRGVSLFERISFTVAEAAQQVREVVMAEAEALAELFPQLDIAAKVENTRQLGAIILGYELHPTETIPRVIVWDTIEDYSSDYRAVVLTPKGLYEARGMNVKARDENYSRTVPDLLKSRVESQDLPWHNMVIKQLGNLLN